MPHGRASATRRRRRARISASSQTGIMPLSSAGTWGGSTLRGPSWIRTAGVWVPMRGSSPIRWASVGLGISSEGRLYVKELRPEDNAVVLSDNAALFTRVLTADRLNLIPTDSLSAPIRAKARIRYRQQEQPCTIEQTGPDTVRVEFDQPQRAVTPGQAVVFYDGDLVIGGATIQKGRES